MPSYAERWLPQYVDELRGRGRRGGRAAPRSSSCSTAARSSRRPKRPPERRRRLPLQPRGAPSGDHCTAVAIAAGGRHVVGHNMDWYVVDAVNNVLFDLTVPDGTRIMGIAGAPYLLMLGMNSHGVGNVSNSVYSTDNRVGVPNAFVRRWTIEATTLEEARARGLLAARARGHEPLPRRPGGEAVGRRDLGHRQRLRRPLRRRVHGAHEPLRRAGDGAVRGLTVRGVARPARRRRSACSPRASPAATTRSSSRPASCAVTSRRPGQGDLRPCRRDPACRPNRA